jgi:hypothetical protein
MRVDPVGRRYRLLVPDVLRNGDGSGQSACEHRPRQVDIDRPRPREPLHRHRRPWPHVPWCLRAQRHGAAQPRYPSRWYMDWDGCGGYHYSDSVIYGFSHTHLSGTGVADLCDVLITPVPVAAMAFDGPRRDRCSAIQRRGQCGLLQGGPVPPLSRRRRQLHPSSSTERALARFGHPR